MGTYARLLLLRWARRPAGQAAAIAAFAFPALAAVYEVRVTRAWTGFPLLAFQLVGGVFAVNLIALSALEERDGGRGRLLRLAGIDGARAIAGLTLFALALVTALCLLAAPVPSLLGRLDAGEWAAFAALLVALAPPALAAGALLPRTLALVLINFLAVGAVLPLLGEPTAWTRSPGLARTVAFADVVLLAALAAGWRRVSARCWP